MNTPGRRAARIVAPEDRRPRAGAGDRFAAGCVAVVARLPLGLATRLPPTVLGFAVLNGFTFGVDLAVLTLLHGGAGWPLGLAITVSYLTAFAVSFALNRALNFRSHAPLGRQSGLYLVAVALNYLLFLLGVGAGLTALGMPYQSARIIAGACEGAFMYSVLRWIVFPITREPGHPAMTASTRRAPEVST